MSGLPNVAEWVFGAILILSSLGVILARKPIYASLSFLLTLLALAGLYQQLSAPFIAVMQVLVYAGAILVIFMFVIVLFQDAHEKMERIRAKSAPFLLFAAGGLFLFTLLFLSTRFFYLTTSNGPPEAEAFGSVETLGKALYADFFFPFEAVTLLFLMAVIGVVFIARKGE
ncbi:NADH-quinone oxidoreductase subunit J [Parachlamydia sp. AcF125]|uniref:NADH-quinone oxidoreductase subunit J family protein n=1 Tax=Parachlamydia sp. AcF125 TaxID=2795736 RepID=UPI001BC8FE02|nr:NADH-quinone oxidoreductase subunit J [Parachlamydia sp. AcF125]MBS4167688.1 NADH-quinone oxidoreductase subunit J [Parachlamydia sp. AcF125]